MAVLLPPEFKIVTSRNSTNWEYKAVHPLLLYEANIKNIFGPSPGPGYSAHFDDTGIEALSSGNFSFQYESKISTIL
jgi:hypothetical protein